MLNTICNFTFCASDIRSFKDENNMYWFFVTDIFKALHMDVTGVFHAVSKLDADEKSYIYSLDEAGSLTNYCGPTGCYVVNEKGLVTLMLRRQSAVTPGSIQHSFRKWVTNVLLPELHKSHITTTKDFNKAIENPEILKDRLSELQSTTPLAKHYDNSPVRLVFKPLNTMEGTCPFSVARPIEGEPLFGLSDFTKKIGVSRFSPSYKSFINKLIDEGFLVRSKTNDMPLLSIPFMRAGYGYRKAGGSNNFTNSPTALCTKFSKKGFDYLVNRWYGKDK